MKRIIAILLAVTMLVMTLTMTGCKSSKKNEESEISTTEYSQSKIPIDEGSVECTIRFAKTVDERFEATEWYDTDEFEINTDIYVIVDFTMINNSDEDGYLDFEVEIPFAKYYSTHEYKKGVIEPHEEIKNVITADGKMEESIRLSEMVFLVRKGGTPFHYTYCFAIKANQVCSDVEFKAIFMSNDGIVIARNRTFSEKYSFVE